jgi:hypothetical protein
MTPHDVALKIAQSAPQHVDFESAAMVTAALASLGYDFVPHGTPGRFIESDEVRHSLALYLAGKTGLHIQIMRNILTAIERSGLRIREPDAHPSGLKTTAHAFATVKPFGAKHAAAQKPIDQRMPGQGRNYA